MNDIYGVKGDSHKCQVPVRGIPSRPDYHSPLAVSAPSTEINYDPLLPKELSAYLK